MNLRMNTGNKRGSYILEAAIVLPVFFISMIVMCSVILMYSCIEGANFAAAAELRRAGAEAIYGNTSAAVPYRISEGIKKTGSMVSGTKVSSFTYRKDMCGTDEVIAVSIRTTLKADNPLDIVSEAEYEISAVTRAYVGKIRNVGNMSADEIENGNPDVVYIFPQSGVRYHSAGCGVLKAASVSAVLTRKLKSKYNSCPVCGSKKAEIGSLIYYFPNDGEDYHLPGCSVLQRNYIRIERDVAVQRGYTPCLKCGG